MTELHIDAWPWEGEASEVIGQLVDLTNAAGTVTDTYQIMDADKDKLILYVEEVKAP